ncbi:SAF domain-containing protein [Mycolicibacter sinensis]
MGESLNPSLASRVSSLLRPDWARTMLARRVVAGGLVVLAGVATIRSDPQSDRVDVVVASRDIAPGTPLTAEDVSLESRSARTVPDGAATDVSSVLHTTLAGPARRGELLTDVRLLGSRLTEAAVGRDARIVGVHPADAALTDLVRTGDVVDIVAADDASDPSGAPKVLATGGIVVLVSDKQNHDDRVVLVALPATAAVAVAGATLAQAVTLTLR